ncbi:MAG: TIGR02710 family CRISPR-associated protein, partial [Candidatus Dadabacteria bacterium]
CAVDVTGGKVPMSLGAFMAAEEAGTPSIYVTAEYDARLQRPRAETARVVRLSTPY